MRSYVGELESHGLLLLSSFNTLSPQKEHDDGHHRHARVKQEMARTPTGCGSPVLESATAGLPRRPERRQEWVLAPERATQIELPARASDEPISTCSLSQVIALPVLVIVPLHGNVEQLL